MSFILSRTLVPTMAMDMLKLHIAGAHHDHPGTPRSRNPLVRFQRGFERGFVRLRTRYQALLATTLERRRILVPLFMAGMVAWRGLVPFIGRDFERGRGW